jgi:hypothetical protein
VAAPVASAPSYVSPSYGREGALGDTCNDDNDCGEGLACYDNFCALGTKGGKKDDSDGDAPGFYFDVGVGVGMALVTNGMKADSAPPEQVAVDGTNMSGWDRASAPTPDQLAAARSYVAGQGWDCEVTPDFSYRNCNVVVGSSGLVAVPILTGAIGYHLTPRLSMALNARYQFGYGEGGLGGFSGGLRLDALLTEPAATGLVFGMFGGILAGPLQARPKRTDGKDGPYAMSGFVGVQAGVRAGYRFTRNLGLVITPAANLMFGPFMFDLDHTGGNEHAF